MSEDTTTFFFSSKGKTPNFDSILEQVRAAYAGAGIGVEEVGGGKHDDGFFIQLWADEDPDAMPGTQAALEYLSGLKSDRVPYACLSLDQTGDSFFYVLRGGSLHCFDDEKELQRYREELGKPSVENSFYDRVDPNHPHLLVRIRFDTVKSLKSLEQACVRYVDSRGEDDYQALKGLIDQERDDGTIEFPLTNVFRDSLYPDGGMDPIATCSLGDLQLGRGLAFGAREKKQLYLGFVFEQAFGIEPCIEGEEIWWARNNIKNGEGRQVLELLESISLYKWQDEWCIDKMQAKFHSPIAGQSGHFFGVPGADVLTEYRPLWDKDDLPANFWP